MQNYYVILFLLIIWVESLMWVEAASGENLTNWDVPVSCNASFFFLYNKQNLGGFGWMPQKEHISGVLPHL